VADFYLFNEASRTKKGATFSIDKSIQFYREIKKKERSVYKSSSLNLRNMTHVQVVIVYSLKDKAAVLLVI
jgi:hypothetical protein